MFSRKSVIFVVSTLASCSAPAKKQGERDTSRTWSYSYTMAGCETGSHSFQEKEKYCEALLDDKFNHGCAAKLRQDRFMSDCSEYIDDFPPADDDSKPAEPQDDDKQPDDGGSGSEPSADDKDPALPASLAVEVGLDGDWSLVSFQTYHSLSARLSGFGAPSGLALSGTDCLKLTEGKASGSFGACKHFGISGNLKKNQGVLQLTLNDAAGESGCAAEAESIRKSSRLVLQLTDVPSCSGKNIGTLTLSIKGSQSVD